jgi:hypothetical protein
MKSLLDLEITLDQGTSHAEETFEMPRAMKGLP